MTLYEIFLIAVAGWLCGSVGFVLGAAWCGLCQANDEYEKQIGDICEP